MKVGIHPDYVDTTITCACGEVVKTRSTRSNIHVESSASTSGSPRPLNNHVGGPAMAPQTPQYRLRRAELSHVVR